MAKRKLAETKAVEETILSPPPDGLLDGNVLETAGEAPSPKKRKIGKAKTRKVDEINGVKKTNKTVKDVTTGEPEDSNAEQEVVKPVAKARKKTKAEKEAEAMPLATRSIGHRLLIGAHVSASGGVQNAVSNSIHIGGNAFALFLKSQRKWANPPLADEHRLSFHDDCKTHAYDQTKVVVPHGSYLVNLAHTDKARTEQAYEAFVDDLNRCERLDIKLYNFHPGVANSTDRQSAIAHLASNLNRAHNATSSVVTLLENMAHGGNTLGSTFEDLRDIIALIHNKERIGVCIDTCHALAAGYDLRSPAAFEATMNSFEEIVGIQYLRAVHMNDSKAPFASHKDLHANIGTGFLGLRAFHNIVNDSRFAGIPLILETPLEAKDENGLVIKDDKGKVKEDKDIWAREIKLLESLVGMDVESEEFLKLEKALARKGEPERKRLTEQIEKKRDKDAAKASRAAKKKGKADKGVKEEEEGSQDSALSELEDD